MDHTFNATSGRYTTAMIALNQVSTRIINRFWQKVLITDSTTECWLWTGGRSDNGYGRVSNNWAAHRLAYFLINGDQPPVVRHSCDIRHCCNPDHLLGGTKKQNSEDMVRRGRSLYGEKSKAAKITDTEAEEIRNGIGKLVLEASAKYGITPGHVVNIAIGRARKIRHFGVDD